MTAKVWLRTSITAALLAVASVASAQQSVSTSDIQRLQDQVYQAGSDVTRLRSTDSSQAARLETELDDLRDEVVYLKVKMRKDGTVSRSEYADVRDRIQTVRSRARGDVGSSSQSGSQSEWGRTDDRNRTSGGTTSGSTSTATRQHRRTPLPVADLAVESLRDSGRPGDRRAAAGRAHVGHRPGRGSLRGHDRRRSLSAATTS